MSGTPAQFGFALRSWLQWHAFPLLTAQAPSAGWTEGGCGYLAHALWQWAGTGEVLTVWGRFYGVAGPLDVQHLVWQHENLYFDGDGASRKETLLLRMMNEFDLEDLEIAPLGPKAKRAMKRADIDCYAAAVPELVAALQKRFGGPANWGFKSEPAGRRAPAFTMSKQIERYGTCWQELDSADESERYLFETWLDWEKRYTSWRWRVSKNRFFATPSLDSLIVGRAPTRGAAEQMAIELAEDGTILAAVHAQKRKRLAETEW
jgi:hypothetical protein